MFVHDHLPLKAVMRSLWGGGLGSLTTCTQNCGSMEHAGRVFNKRLPKVFTKTAKVLDYDKFCGHWNYFDNCHRFKVRD
jgi:hypothetical protein